MGGGIKLSAVFQMEFICNRYIGGASQYIRKPEPPRKAAVF
jgi:hypothetical protein